MVERCRFSANSNALMALAILSLVVAVPLARSQMACHDMSGMQPVPPPEQLPAPQKMTGIGNGHLKITATPEAQMWFDQGLNLLHDFWDYESAKAFEQAARVDPKCAMCQWGIAQALANGHNQGGDYSQVAIARARALEKHASKEERLIIEATALEFDEQGGDSKRAEATAKWREAVAADPKNPQPKIFLAESLLDGYDDAGEPKPGTKQGIAVLEEALKANPDDSALNHYWIHAMEPSSHPERAVESAKRLAGEAPTSGHMVHMPGHIFYRTGDYATAEHWFSSSTAVDEAYLQRTHVSVDDDWNYVHNLMYGIDNLMEEGKLHEAAALSAKLAGARGTRADTLYIGAPRDGMTRINTLLPITLRKGDWRGVQALLEAGGPSAKPDAKLENLLFLTGELNTFAHGMSAIEAGNLATAQKDSDLLDATLWRKSQSLKDAEAAKKDDAKKDAPKKDAPVTTAISPDAQAGPLLQVLGIMSLELRASILASQKDVDGAKHLFTQAAHEEKQLGYREPPMYIRPVGETEGFALLRAGDADGAHAAFASAVVDRPNEGFGLYGMALASEAAKKPAQAREEYAKFLEAWRNADASEELEHARAYVQGQPTMAMTK